jgi:hypothetical protein
MNIGSEPLAAKIGNLFRRDLAAENDFLRAENRVLRELLPKRPRLTDNHRRLLVKYKRNMDAPAGAGL